MRIVMVVLGLAALALAAPVGPATAAKSKMGCEIGSEVWNASAGKCEPGKPKYTKRAAAKAPAAKTPPAKKAPAKK